MQVSTAACAPVDCSGPNPPVPLPVSFTATALDTGTSAALQVLQSSEAGGGPVIGYEVRYTTVADVWADADASSFAAWTAAGALPVSTPGTTTPLEIDGLTPLTYYAVGIRAIGVCGSSAPSFQRIQTPAIKFTQLSGCFVATAAFGSDMAPEVALLRKARDLATARSTLAATAVDLYYRSSPPAAAALSRSPTARAVVRSALRALVR